MCANPNYSPCSHRKFYCIFDRARNRIGLAYSRHDPAMAELQRMLQIGTKIESAADPPQGAIMQGEALFTQQN